MTSPKIELTIGSDKELIGYLKELFPYGHPDFIGKCVGEMDLHSRKNHDYAFGGDPVGNFDRVANILAQYPGLDPSKPNVVAVIYLLKQLDAALWMEAKGHTAAVEGVDERWQDISVYSKIISILVTEGKSGKRREKENS
jgi:hypothetical protein